LGKNVEAQKKKVLAKKKEYSTNKNIRKSLP
jgi:hypothetical protein